MSGSDLGRIQAQLKIAIESHQMLVARMKSDPQNTGIKKQLNELHTQIRALSEKQKAIVNQLKEIVIKQNETLKTSSVPANTTQPTNLSTKPAVLLSNNNNNDTALKVVTANAPPKLSHKAVGPPTKTLVTIAPKPVVQQQYQQIDQKSPLKVPQFHVSRPSILGSSRQSRTSVTSNISVKKEPAPQYSNSISSLKRSVLADRNKELSASDRQKHEYMARLDLITPDVLKDLQSRRSERKRRSTANPQFAYGNYEAERRRPVNYLMNVSPRIKRRPPPAAPPPQQQTQQQQQQAPRKRGRPPKRRFPNGQRPGPSASPALPSTPSDSRPDTPNSPLPQPISPTPTSSSIESPVPAVSPSPSMLVAADVHEDYCAVCRRSGELLMCDTCSLVYHLNCVEPALTAVPTGMWSCQKCTSGDSSNGSWSGNLAVVHSYIQQKAVKEEELRKQQRHQHELNIERSQLESKAKQLQHTVSQQLQQKNELRTANQAAQQAVNQIKGLIKLFQNS